MKNSTPSEDGIVADIGSTFNTPPRESRLSPDKVDDIAALLGAVKVELVSSDYPTDDRYYITLAEPAGVRLFIAGPSWRRKGRIYISGEYPSYADSQGCKQTVYPSSVWVENVRQSAPEITCAVERTAAQIAKDIQRRFIPEFLHVWALCKANLNQNYTDDVSAAAAQIAALTSGQIWGQENNQIRFEGGEITYIRVSSGTVDVKFSDVTKEQLARMIAARKG